MLLVFSGKGAVAVCQGMLHLQGPGDLVRVMWRGMQACAAGSA
jgi:hypothetical protein